MKNTRLIFLFIVISSAFKIASAQAGTWTWMKGDSTTNSPGSYGVQGIPSPANEPRERYACASWTDTAGSFWVYSGTNASDDLWKFDPQTSDWTWMTGTTNTNATKVVNTAKGIYNPGNSPGQLGYGMFTWVTANNHLWLYGGGLPYPYFVSADMWQYDPSINQWAWMGNFGTVNYGTKGVGTATTMPGARYESDCAWTDSSGNLWLFGGAFSGFGTINDLWKYNVSTGIWTWISGTGNASDTGSYGTIGVPSANNYPSARETTLFWQDSSYNFWLAGGAGGKISSSSPLMFQDIWKFNPYTLQWTWVKGAEGDDSTMVGANCVADVMNKPGPRYENRANWKICDDLIITYSGFNDFVNANGLNDMWAYKVSQNEWIKVNEWDSVGRFGQQGVTGSSAYPTFRSGPVGFKDKDNNLWMFGGSAASGRGDRNDLWKYALDPLCLGSLSCNASLPSSLHDSTYTTAASCRSVCNGSGGVVATGGTGPYSYQWQPTGDTTAVVNNLCTGTYYVTIMDANNDTITDSITIFAPIKDPLPIMVDKYSICMGDTSHLCAPTGFSVYNWSDSNTTPCTIATVTGSYHVTIKDANGCIIPTTAVPITVYPLSADSISADTNAFCFGDSAHLCPSTGFVGYQWNTGDTTPCIYVREPGGYSLIVTDNNGCTASSDTLDIAVYPDPLDSIYTNQSIFCVNDSAQVCAQQSFFTYQWNVGGTDSCIYAKQAGDYYVTLTDANGCTAVSNHLSLSVYSAQSVSITRNGDSLSSFGGVSYQWLLDGNPINGAAGPVYVAHQQGSYAVEVTDSIGCTATSTPVFVSGIENLEQDEVLLFPNPSTGSWQLTIGSNLIGSDLGVYDDEGRLVWKDELRSMKYQITIRGLPSGVYYLRISNIDVNVIRKMVKM